MSHPDVIGRKFEEECVKANLKVKYYEGSKRNYESKFPKVYLTDQKKFLVIMDRENVHMGLPRIERVEIEVDQDHKNCLFGDGGQSTPSSLFLLVHSHNIITGFDVYVGLMRPEERQDCYIGGCRLN